MTDYSREFRRCTAEIVISAAINEALTLANQRSFNADEKPWTEDRVAREFGAEALDHFRAIRTHKAALKDIIEKGVE